MIQLVHRMTLFIQREWSSLYTEWPCLYKENDQACIQNDVHIKQNGPACIQKWRLYKQNDLACIQNDVYINRMIQLVYSMTLFIQREWSSLYTEWPSLYTGWPSYVYRMAQLCIQNNPVYQIQSDPACFMQHDLVYVNRMIQLVYRIALFIQREWSSLYTEWRCIYKQNDPACIQNDLVYTKTMIQLVYRMTFI